MGATNREVQSSAREPEQSANEKVKLVTGPPKVPPDGKWGWIIVIAYAMANVRTSMNC